MHTPHTPVPSSYLHTCCIGIFPQSVCRYILFTQMTSDLGPKLWNKMETLSTSNIQADPITMSKLVQSSGDSNFLLPWLSMFSSATSTLSCQHPLHAYGQLCMIQVSSLPTKLGGYFDWYFFYWSCSVLVHCTFPADTHNISHTLWVNLDFR